MRRRRAGESTSPSISPFSLPGYGFSNGEERGLPFSGVALFRWSRREIGISFAGVDNGHGIARRGEHELDDDGDAGEERGLG
jgi:hypothetical protein